MKLFDFDHPFFLPLWRRVIVVLFCLGWAVVEFASGTPFWGMLFGAIGLWSAWSLLLRFDEAAARARLAGKDGK